MIRRMKSLAKNYCRLSRNKKHYGLDKPVFIVAAITLAIIFVSIYFTSVSGWMEDALNLFGERSSEVSPG